MSKFLINGQLLPAGLVQLLLLMARIEPNPGPITGRGWLCCICREKINESFPSVPSCQCNQYSHVHKKGGKKQIAVG